MLRRWIWRRRLTLSLVVLFVSWYFLQRIVVASFGGETAIWWFYFTRDPSPGYLLAAISHDMAGVGHLQRDVVVLLLAGSVAEPYLDRRRFAALVLVVSSLSIVFANVISVAIGTQWILAGPSGGVYGGWAYIGIKYRSKMQGADLGAFRDLIVASVIAVGALTIFVIPVYDMFSSGIANVSHVIGILFGYGVAIAEEDQL